MMSHTFSQKLYSIYFIISFVHYSLSHSIYVFFTLVLSLLQRDIHPYFLPSGLYIEFLTFFSKFRLLFNILLFSDLSFFFLFLEELVQLNPSCFLSSLFFFILLILKLSLNYTAFSRNFSNSFSSSSRILLSVSLSSSI